MGLARQALEAGCHIYVEKPFSPTAAEALELVQLADRSRLKICSGHQLLFEPPSMVLEDLLPALGRISHIESYFSFRTVRRAPGGRVPLRSDLQLLDILPHPTYLLLHFLALAEPDGETEVTALEVGESGTIHGLVRRGALTANLTVSLQARPVESFVRICGANGSLHADFVRGSVQRLIGPGTSGIDKVLAPYRTAMQLLAGTTGAVGRRVLKRQKSYPGLVEIFEAFYDAARNDSDSPTSAESIVDTVRICEHVAQQLQTPENAVQSGPIDSGAASIIVTGGTGFLGTAICRAAVREGVHVSCLARREPAAWEKVAGVEYLIADLGVPLDTTALPRADAIIHAAAETAGSWPEHQRNSIDATRNVLEAASQGRHPQRDSPEFRGGA